MPYSERDCEEFEEKRAVLRIELLEGNDAATGFFASLRYFEKNVSRDDLSKASVSQSPPHFFSSSFQLFGSLY